MPWTTKDVDSHKKGLTPEQKKKWVSMANGILKDCQSKGGKDCEGKAIRVANSKFALFDLEEVILRLEALKKENPDFEDWEYLIHHMHKDKKTGKDIVHHCFLADHLGNLFVFDHVKDSKGKFRHCLIGLKEDQEVYWSDEEAETDGQKIPCANRQFE